MYYIPGISPDSQRDPERPNGVGVCSAAQYGPLVVPSVHDQAILNIMHTLTDDGFQHMTGIPCFPQCRWQLIMGI